MELVFVDETVEYCGISVHCGFVGRNQGIPVARHQSGGIQRM